MYLKPMTGLQPFFPQEYMHDDSPVADKTQCQRNTFVVTRNLLLKLQHDPLLDASVTAKTIFTCLTLTNK